MAAPIVLHLRLAPGTCDPGQESSSGYRQVWKFCADTAPAWQILSDEILLDLTGCGRLLGWSTDGPAAVSARAARSFSVSAAGSGPTVLAARLASGLGVGQVTPTVWNVPPGSVKCFLAFFPINVLIGQSHLIERLQALGVRTLGDLQVVPRDLLRAVFGKRALNLVAEAEGSTKPSFSGPNSESTGRETVALARLQRPLTCSAGLRAMLECLALRALSFCPAGPRGRSCWILRVTRTDGKSCQAQTRSQDSASVDNWRRLLAVLAKGLPDTRQGISRVELLAGAKHPVSCHQTALFASDEKSQALARAIDQVNSRSSRALRSASEDLLAQWGVQWD